MRGDLEEVPACDLLLFWASRSAHLETLILPMLKQGKTILCNRYESSSWAFQIRGEERAELKPLFYALRSLVPNMLFPNAYFFFDLPAELAHERMRRRAEQDPNPQTRFDVKPLAYHQRVREGFLEFAAIAEKDGSKVFVIDAAQGVLETHRELWTHVQEILSA